EASDVDRDRREQDAVINALVAVPLDGAEAGAHGPTPSADWSAAACAGSRHANASSRASPTPKASSSQTSRCSLRCVLVTCGPRIALLAAIAAPPPAQAQPPPETKARGPGS